MNRRWRNFVFPRRRRMDPPWSAPTAPLTFVRAVARRLPRARGGEFPAPPVTTPQPVFTVGRRRATLPAARRGEIFVVPFPIVAPPVVQPAPAFIRSARRLVRPRGGEFFFVPVLPPPGPAPLPPTVRRAPHSYSVLRRPTRFAVPPWTGAAPVQPPPFMPTVIRPAGRRLPARRGGEYLQLPPPGQQVPIRMRRQQRPFMGRRSGEFLPLPPSPPAPVTLTPQWIKRALRPVAGRRGGEFFSVPFAAPVVPWPARRPVRLVALRRGRFSLVVPAPVVQAAPSMVPAMLAPRRRTAAKARRGGFLPVPLAVGAAPQRDLLLTVGPAQALWSAGPAGALWSAGPAQALWDTGKAGAT